MRITLWILVAATVSAFVLKFYGRSGIKFVLAFAGTLIAKDAIFHFWGLTAESIFVGIVLVCAISIYMARRMKQHRLDVRKPKENVAK
jgi:hypothetical protein